MKILVLVCLALAVAASLASARVARREDRAWVCMCAAIALIALALFFATLAHGFSHLHL